MNTESMHLLAAFDAIENSFVNCNCAKFSDTILGILVGTTAKSPFSFSFLYPGNLIKNVLYDSVFLLSSFCSAMYVFWVGEKCHGKMESKISNFCRTLLFVCVCVL